MTEPLKSFAVVDSALKRSTAYTPQSSHWTLYDPKMLAEHLGTDVEAATSALEICGFSKAVRIREELIRWKTRMLEEEKAINAEYEELNREREELRRRRDVIRYALRNVRNLLRLPREEETI